MGWGASILQKLGRSGEALDLAQKRLGRYPDWSEARADLAEHLWMAGRYSEAAFELNNPQYQVDVLAWRDSVSRNFARVFRDKPQDAALKALDALLAQRTSWWKLQTMIEGLDKEGRFELAFKLQSQVLRVAVTDYADTHLHAYRYLTKWKGQAEALSWLRLNFKESLLEPASVVFFDQKELELLWNFVRPPKGEQLSSTTWLLRAYAASLEGLANHPHRGELLAYYEGKTWGDFRFRLGRYLLGLGELKELVELPKSEEERCELIYVLGIRAMSDGRYPEASDWFHLLTTRCKGDFPAFKLARTILGDWYSESRSLDFLAKQHIW